MLSDLEDSDDEDEKQHFPKVRKRISKTSLGSISTPSYLIVHVLLRCDIKMISYLQMLF